MPVPVVSVGNVTSGGTGKTPVVVSLCRHLESKGMRVGIVSRGYGRSDSDVAEVTVESSRYFGDEPMMYKMIQSDWPVYVAPERFTAGEALLRKHDAQVLVLDDGFQHRSLYRDLDLVLIDATQKFSDYKVLPEGMAREALAALNRASFLILTKLEVPGAYTRTEIEEFFKKNEVTIPAEKWIEAKFSLETPVNLQSGKPILLEEVQAVHLLSGIGRPRSFEKMCEHDLKVKVLEHFVFRDHHDYRERDLQSCLKTSGPILTTEKDAVKLRRLNLPLERFFTVPLRVAFCENKGRLYESLDRLSAQSL